MIYVKKLILPDEDQEFSIIASEQRTCFNTFYPFKIFPEKGLESVNFESVTIFYGGNGSGKSTLINVMAKKLNSVRYTQFNDSPFFDKFVDICKLEYMRPIDASYVLASDDVFDCVLNMRFVNDKIDTKREELFDKYVSVHREVVTNPDIVYLKGLDDYERWSQVKDILSPRRSQSQFIRKNVARDIDLRSNGETAMRYFIDRIEEDALYFLDEPENSLSIEFQIQLAEYIQATARATKSQFIIATHSPIFLSLEKAKIYNLDDYPVSVCKWTQLPNVRKYFDFFMSHKEEFL